MNFAGNLFKKLKVQTAKIGKHGGLKQCMLCNLALLTLLRFRCRTKNASIDPCLHQRFDAFSTFYDTKTFEKDRSTRCDIS